jgi:hypothetical protein
MMNRPTRTLAALTGAAALTVAGMSPASGAFWAHNDAVGDVVVRTSMGTTVSGPHPAPANSDTDITRFTARHTARRVVLKTTLRDITTVSGEMAYEIRTGKRHYRVHQRLGSGWTAPAAFVLVDNGSGEAVRCSGVRHSVDRTTEQVVVNIPRSCLGRPRWVRVRAVAVMLMHPGAAVFWDDALRDGWPVNEPPPAFSPRIQRG